jgi:hypothetical protein
MPVCLLAVPQAVQAVQVRVSLSAHGMPLLPQVQRPAVLPAQQIRAQHCFARMANADR